MSQSLNESGIHDISVRTNGAITQYMAVVLNSVENGDHIAALPSAQADVCHGIAQEGSTASGDRITVRQAGESYVIADSAGTVGRPVFIGAGATGHVDDTSSDNWASGDGLVGYYNEAPTASGDKVVARLDLSELMP